MTRRLGAEVARQKSYTQLAFPELDCALLFGDLVKEFEDVLPNDQFFE